MSLMGRCPPFAAHHSSHSTRSAPAVVAAAHAADPGLIYSPRDEGLLSVRAVIRRPALTDRNQPEAEGPADWIYATPDPVNCFRDRVESMTVVCKSSGRRFV